MRVSTGLLALSLGVLCGCGDEAATKSTGPASTALELAKKGHAADKASDAHKNTVAAAITLAEGQVELKELDKMYSSENATIESKKVCFVKWTHGSDSGVVPNTRYECDAAKDDYAKKRLKRKKDEAMKTAEEWRENMKVEG